MRGGLAIYGCVFVVLVFLLALQYIGMHTLYKVDNMIIFMQVLTLSLVSINLSFARRDYYRFLYGFRWSAGNWNIDFLQYSIIFRGKPGYLENAPNNAPFLLTVDNNFLRNCVPLIFLVGIAFFFRIIVYFILDRQVFCKWKNKFDDEYEEEDSRIRGRRQK